MSKLIKFIISELGRIAVGLILFISAFVCDKLGVVYVALALYIVTLVFVGMPVFYDAVRGILRRDLLDEKFLMSIASIGAMFVGEYSEGVAVMLFFLVGEYFEHKAVAKSRKSIKALMDIRPDEANVMREEREITVDADEVEVGEIIIIRAGERVPIDSVVISGNADLDTSALTGESIPRAVCIGMEINAGSVVIGGVLTAKAIRTAEKSSAARILELVENANERKSKTENFITRFSHFYTPIVVLLAVSIAILPSLFKLTSWQESIYRALIFLVISCPCALVISVPMAFFGGIGSAASRGILYKGGNTFSSLARADSFAFDKTGTLTSGEFTITEVYAVSLSEKELLYYAASAEYGSNHPIAECVKKSAESTTVPTETNELAGRGVVAVIEGRKILVGNSTLMSDYGIRLPEDAPSDSVLFVAKDGDFLGWLRISDTIKQEAKSAVKALRKTGAKRLMILSGDKHENVSRIADELEIKEFYSELLPENKYQKLQEVIDSSKSTVFVGDGINDAPAIALADVGIAMGTIGSDSAIESADVVIMSDNIERIATAIKIARKTVNIAIQNIVFALGVKAIIMVLGALGFANMWLAVFADVGVAALAILNSMRTLLSK